MYPDPCLSLRFWKDRLKSKDAQLEKLCLKNTSLRQQITKMNQQLTHKEEMGEVLHVVDFDQLKIENQQYMTKLEEKNKALLSLKLTTSNTVQVMFSAQWLYVCGAIVSFLSLMSNRNVWCGLFSLGSDS